jgi:hypothetical protein
MATAAQKTGNYVKTVYQKINDAITERMPKSPEVDPGLAPEPGEIGGKSRGYQLHLQECAKTGETPMSPSDWAKQNK